ncbi:MAG: hypothetical protein E7C82_02300 [Anaerococcus hydrogenalis]|uniref:hypothetical protein n=1 Tax=Anaerococcus hydrogenalis TaxID=33029 RepID=UPI0028FFE154|nr:hypothetical protein [Anaerococcus hydrogenalis]MDU2582512.1 hypothetical protein [Anaerococcus hydrogenalis]
MDNKKFNSFFAYFVGILMVISFIYILFLLKPKKVFTYKVAKDIRYSGEIVKNKLNGKGNLTTPEGKYIGEFKDSRFDGLGKFVGDDFTYFSKFNKNKANKDIKIKLKDGYIYKKVKNGWMRLEGKDEN